MPGIRREHRWQPVKKRQLTIKLQTEVTEERLRACFDSYPLACSMTFEEAMKDDTLRRVMEMHARYGVVRDIKDSREKDDDSDSVTT
ncbi:hypothetical protein NX722_13540 [Endozoicomonas gorgoniicola]|uniref:Uncharacterized protein n=1 Tax=Endozoicomonas gorgoniicola TaxID=1234144 RepID=A0ABT3MW73_9GAMM|nr:hypothetical protein [Endozoicomonas gorgoniicola]MCW7553631.1 hypothetical protein [Endozoicomonas gorgoniicola]